MFFFQIFIFCFFVFLQSSQAFPAAAVEADADEDVVICICNQKVAHKLCFMLIFVHTHTRTHKELDDRHFNVPSQPPPPPPPLHTWNLKNEHRMQRTLRASCLNISISEEGDGEVVEGGRESASSAKVSRKNSKGFFVSRDEHTNFNAYTYILYKCLSVCVCVYVWVWPCLVLPLWIAEIVNCAASLWTSFKTETCTRNIKSSTSNNWNFNNFN